MCAGYFPSHRALRASRVPRRRQAFFGDGNRKFAAQILRRERIFAARISGNVRRHEFAAVNARAGAKVNGRNPHCGSVSASCSTTKHVLPRSRRPLSVASRRLFVALVQARCSAHPVCKATPTRPAPIWVASRMRVGLAAAERAALAVEREIAEADVFQKAERARFPLMTLMRDFLLKFRELETAKNSSAFSTDNAQTSMMERPGISADVICGSKFLW